MLVLASGWGALLVLLAGVLPIVSGSGSSTSSASSPPGRPGESAASPEPSSYRLVPDRRMTLVQDSGYRVLLLVGIALFVALLVSVLILLSSRTRSAVPMALAWALAVAELLASGVGFLTFLIGIFAAPTGLFLVSACAIERNAANRSHRFR
jgi:hypothetical protein